MLTLHIFSEQLVVVASETFGLAAITNVSHEMGSVSVDSDHCLPPKRD